MSKQISICRNNDFRKIYARGKSFVSSVLIIYVFKNRFHENRVGITTSKKIGNAVKRNRARRVIREAYREICGELAQGYDFIFVARGRTPYVKTNVIKKQMVNLFKSANIYKVV